MSQSIFALDVRRDEPLTVRIDRDEPPDARARIALRILGDSGHSLRIYFNTVDEVETFARKVADGVSFLKGEMPT